MRLESLGATSRIIEIFIADSSSTTGAGLTGLAFGTSGLTAYYHRDTDTTATAITLATMTVGTWTSSGFKEIDATNMPGWYQLGVPNAALASGAKSVSIHLKGAGNMAPLPIEIRLVSFNIDDSVRAGLTALPNAAAGAAGGLLTVEGYKKNTAATAFGFFMYDTNGQLKSGLSVTATRSIDGGAFSACANAVSENASVNGAYKITLSALDLNGDEILLMFAAAGQNTTGFKLRTTS